MLLRFLFTCCLLLPLSCLAQGLKIGGYLDAYYGYDWNRPANRQVEYMVSSSRHNQIDLHLLMLEVTYQSERVRAAFRPAVGSYMQRNYSAEPAGLQYLYEANAGFRLLPDKGIWLEVGVFSSPIGNETPLSFDQLLYTRALTSEYVPYYLAGARLIVPLSSKFTWTAYALNGWQVISDDSSHVCGLSQLEWKPNGQWALNWDVFIGNAQTDYAPLARMRYFSDVYASYAQGRWKASGLLYGGLQKSLAPDGSEAKAYWWAANLMGSYRYAEQQTASMRLEYFSDPDNVQLLPAAAPLAARVGSLSVGWTLQPLPQVQLRLESRSLLASKEIFAKGDGSSTRFKQWAVAAMAVRF